MILVVNIFLFHFPNFWRYNWKDPALRRRGTCIYFFLSFLYFFSFVIRTNTFHRPTLQYFHSVLLMYKEGNNLCHSLSFLLISMVLTKSKINEKYTLASLSHQLRLPGKYKMKSQSKLPSLIMKKVRTIKQTHVFLATSWHKS